MHEFSKNKIAFASLKLMFNKCFFLIMFALFILIYNSCLNIVDVFSWIRFLTLSAHWEIISDSVRHFVGGSLFGTTNPYKRSEHKLPRNLDPHLEGGNPLKEVPLCPHNHRMKRTLDHDYLTSPGPHC